MTTSRPLGRFGVYLLGRRVVEAGVTAATRRHLRIITYHRVTRPDRFRFQLEHVARHYRVVEPATVADAIAGGRQLEPRSVWVTFDDGDPSVADVAQPLLDALGIPATLFVCPGVIGTTTPFWWQTVGRAMELGLSVDVGDRPLSGRSTIACLQRLDDRTRRTAVQRVAQSVTERTGNPPTARQLSEGELRHWADAGHTLGNHTWDHPLLDRCEPDEQERQVASADEWLSARFPGWQRVFAYPSGRWAVQAESALARLGYGLGLLFDQHLARPGCPPLRVSRLRISADAAPPEFRARLSGAWSITSGIGTRR